jgi:phosphatidate cytidylyltransferase
MLKHRIFTALILIPIVLALIFFAPHAILIITGVLLLLGCAIEWTRLIPTASKIQSFLFVFGLFISLRYSTHFFHFYQFAALLLWIFIFYALLYFPASQQHWGEKKYVALGGLILLPLCWTSFTYIYLQPQGPALILYFLLLVWATDTGAYFAGKITGKHKLIPKVSPGKTIEGTMGGLVCALLVSLAAFLYFSPPSTALWFTQAIGTILLSMVGDLFISMLKRRVKCKDTSQILPGHGGLLDRLDSLIAAAPLFYFLT